jgi:hypothetical protein
MPLSPEEQRALVPELPEWNNGKGIDLDGWAHCTANSWSLIGASRVLWPDFVLFDGCVFRGDGVDEANYRDWMVHTGGNRSKVEAVLNHRHVLDEFPTISPGSPEAQVLYLGGVMAAMLRAKLAHEFPERTFEVTWDCDRTDDMAMWSVTFFQPGTPGTSRGDVTTERQPWTPTT